MGAVRRDRAGLGFGKPRHIRATRVAMLETKGRERDSGENENGVFNHEVWHISNP